MAWTDGQRKTFLAACSAAAISESQRYLVMRHAGCCVRSGAGRPSVTHARNTTPMFEAAMSIIEGFALGQGRALRPPRHASSWRDAANRGRDRSVVLAQSIAAEGIQRVPGRFRDGLLAYAIAHVTAGDEPQVASIPRPRSLDECDAAQLYRVIECLKAMVGRELLRRGLQPRTFTAPAEARRRSAAPVDGHNNAPMAEHTKEATNA